MIYILWFIVPIFVLIFGVALCAAAAFSLCVMWQLAKMILEIVWGLLSDLGNGIVWCLTR